MPSYSFSYPFVVTFILFASSTAATLSIPDENPKERILLLHMHDNAPFFSELGSITLGNKLRYAARHQYEVVAHTPAGTRGLWRATTCDSAYSVKRGDDCFVPRHDFAIDKRAPTFGKIKLARAACIGRPGYWMLWSDADALVVNQTLPLTYVIDDRFDLILSQDWLMINAGMLLIKCTPWIESFLSDVYNAREFDKARALDQSAFQHFIDNLPDRATHIGYAPKHRINVYIEEYRPGDFLLHMAGKLYEATTEGAIALARQFDALSIVDDVRDIEAFFQTRYLLNKYAGVCLREGAHDSACKPDDPERLKLEEPLSAMSTPNRYKHVGLRYYWLGDWKDVHDASNWDAGRQLFAPNGSKAYMQLNGETNMIANEAEVDDFDRERNLRQAANDYLEGMRMIIEVVDVSAGEREQVGLGRISHEEL